MKENLTITINFTNFSLSTGFTLVPMSNVNTTLSVEQDMPLKKKTIGKLIIAIDERK